MPITPDLQPPRGDAQRERTARCLMDYLDQLPMGTEQRLELGLSVLRELPAEASSGQALEALHTRLPVLAPEAFPSSHPAIDRGHMPAQYLGRPRKGLPGFLAQWAWLLVVGLLLTLTLLLNSLQ
ncbi:hypothetical protein GM415_17440 [Pseudodesulfovibrio cashew]|uniref:Uncharacterized protein n=1 Tax=Pseudodesulfovibrio cashew TaxID=2678688 RepID=A0A6I6JLG0_9BACT|nr:hypothetical protein [Pseudodesulfovibrio cashew]QGY41828.1 hypothetical protein GM415_17440 [Pseudodesulfovibrio cashew]